MDLFRELAEKEIIEFKQWARDNFDPEFMNIERHIWHPVIVAECDLMVKEQSDV